MKNKRKKPPVKKATPIWLWVAIGAVLLVIGGFVVSQLTKTAAAPPPPEISVTQAAQMRDQGAFVLDVREPSEWTQFHIPGATLIPLGELPDRLGEVPKDRLVVVVCRTGHRSAQGRDILLGAGYKNVTSMAGGVTEWQAQGLPTASGE